jgi:hypothetical protein
MADHNDLLPFRMRPDRALAIVRRLAADTSCIAWSVHALQQMQRRDISDLMAIEVLRGGYIKGEVEPGRSFGEWKLKVVRRIKGRRDAGVAVVIIREARLFVKTVEWED